MRVTFLVGLPGSGKTFLGKQLPGRLLDDFSLSGSLLGWEGDIILADVFLCDPECRAKAIKEVKELYPEAELSWVFFENNPEKCRNNVKLRQDGRKVDAMIRFMSQVYVIPPDQEIRSIWQNASSAKKISPQQ